MSHGTKDGKISAADEEYDVRELWMEFIGDNWKTKVVFYPSVQRNYD